MEIKLAHVSVEESGFSKALPRVGHSHLSKTKSKVGIDTTKHKDKPRF